ncbi:MAG: serine hydrolase domain-containing protein, partial [Promethearchaeota archaeon]
MDKDVNTYFNDWKIPENDFTKDEKVTLRRLLTHTAGINRPDSMYSYDEGTTPTLLNVLNGESPATNDPVKIEFIPGSKNQYSNLGFDIIQKLMEDVTGKSINQLLREIIFEPLEMNARKCTVEYPLPIELAMIAIDHHTPDGKTAGKGLHHSAYGHGNLSINPWDFAKFIVEIMQSYQGKSNKILSQDMT